jgi:hypothetical protein
MHRSFSTPTIDIGRHVRGCAHGTGSISYANAHGQCCCALCGARASVRLQSRRWPRILRYGEPATKSFTHLSLRVPGPRCPQSGRASYGGPSTVTGLQLPGRETPLTWLSQSQSVRGAEARSATVRLVHRRSQMSRMRHESSEKRTQIMDSTPICVIT